MLWGFVICETQAGEFWLLLVNSLAGAITTALPVSVLQTQLTRSFHLCKIPRGTTAFCAQADTSSIRHGRNHLGNLSKLEILGPNPDLLIRISRNLCLE